MIPYSKRTQAVIKDMLINPNVAKSPTRISSLSTPTITRLNVVSGNIKEPEVAYRVSAINKYGETVASEEKTIRLGTILDNVNIINSEYAPGILPRGVYYYGVTAVNTNGETNILNSYTVNNGGTPAPTWANNPAVVTKTGLLPKGTNYYAITTVVDGKETDLSTFQEVIIEQDNSSVTLQFLAVEGAESYNIYGRDRTQPKRLANVIAGVFLDNANQRQVINWLDTGEKIPTEDVPTFNNTTAGIKIQWEPVEGDVTGYKIYGRTAPAADDLQFIAEVGANVISYKDQGYISPSYTPPKRNTSGYSSGNGVVITWNVVPNATGYRIYGRDVRTEEQNETKDKVITEQKGFLATIPDGSITSWVDSGVISPDYTIKYPTVDTTDGTTGILGSVIPDGETLEINDRGILSVKGGIDSFLGRSTISNVKDQDVLVFDEKTQKWSNFDLSALIFTLISVTDGQVVAKDEKFEAYKDNLVNVLNTINTFKDDYVALQQKVTYLEKCIETIKRDIGTSYFPDKQDTPQ